MVKIELRNFGIKESALFLFYVTFSKSKTEFDFPAPNYLWRGLKGFLTGKQKRFAIYEGKRFVGAISLFSDKGRKNEVGGFTVPKYRNKGIAKAAIKELEKYCSKELKISKFLAVTDINNLKSQKWLRSCGFKKIKTNKKNKEYIWGKKLK